MLPKYTKKVQFNVQSLYPEATQNTVTLLVQRYSFWVAAFSIFSFVIGNLVGQHGWYAVYKSVLGREMEQQIVFSGTVAPVDKVPNYVAWAEYGGNSHDHTFRQIPSRLLVQLPEYNANDQSHHTEISEIGQIYSVGYNGSYATGGHGDGYHPGTDIRLPIGTPVRTIANGIVVVAETKNGFGETIVVKHPNVPDPENRGQTTTLYSVYAHLSSIHVHIDDVVSKGELIGLSGNTGNSSGPHLHFQIDRDSAPWHPYWPANNSLALSELHTIDPMAFVQEAHTTTTIVESNRTITSRTTVARRAAPEPTSLADRAAARRAVRLAERGRSTTVQSRTTVTTARDTEPTQNPTTETIIRKTEPAPKATSVLGTQSVSEPKTVVTSVDIRHDGDFEPRKSEQIRIRLLDTDGNKVKNPILSDELYLKTAYGEASFSKPILTEKDFTDGEAVIDMRSVGRRTVVIEIQPFGTLSKPLSLER